MTAPDHAANARFLDCVVAWARDVLSQAVDARGGGATAVRDADAERTIVERFAALRETPGIPYFVLADRLEFRAADHLLVSLCLARRVDATVRALLAQLHTDGNLGEVTVDAICHLFLRGDFALGAYLHQSLTGRAMLVTERVLERPGPGDIALRRPLRLTTAALEVLLGETPDGTPHFDVVARSADRRGAVVDPAVRARVVAALRDYTLAVARDPAPFRDAGGRIAPPAVLLFGPPGEGKTQLAFDVAFETFPAVVHVDCTSLVGADPAPVLRRVIDTAMLRQAAIVLEDAHHLFRAGAAPRVLRSLLAGCPACVLFTSADVDLDAKLAELFLLRAEIESSSATRRRIWEGAFPPALRTGADLEIDVLAERYRFDGRTITTTTRLATARSLGNGGRPLRMTDVDDAAQLMLNTQMGSVARRLGGQYTFDDLVLPDEQRRQLQDIVDAGRSWDVVMSTWGFAERLASGKSLTALFWGKPGTGKSFAARIIANLLGKRLFAVNLDQILSKWMGETEKNIRTVFQAAASTGAVLLFDEADSLFAARVEATSAHDRSANMITNLLLQEVEEYAGIVVLTTNLKENIDEAFERRMLFNVEFPFPDEELRQRIWETIPPYQAPIAADVNFAALAKAFKLAGGEIKKCLVRAAMRAHAEGSPITHQLIAEVCAEEYALSGRVTHG